MAFKEIAVKKYVVRLSKGERRSFRSCSGKAKALQSSS
jgi:hypothetical protein